MKGDGKAMKKANAAPTMKDVAREAGVALGTVSKVVRGIPVGEEYRLKVEEAIEKLHYQVNSYAQGLKSSRTNTVAVLIPNTQVPFFASLTYQLNLSLSRRQVRMMLCCTDYDLALEQTCVTMVQQNKVDGIIGLTYNPNLSVSENTPFVSIDRCISPSIPCVSSDNFQGGRMAAEKLADLGCTRVAFFRTGSVLDNEPNKRKAGFEDGCRARGLPYDMCLLDDNEEFTGWYLFLEEHFHNGKLDYDGIFCVTDHAAYQIITYLKKLSVRVPEDVQVIGFDGVRRFGDQDLECSTIIQPIPEIAEMCVQLLLQDEPAIRPPLVCLPVTYAPGGTTRE